MRPSALAITLALCAAAAAAQPDGELIFPLEHWHNHGSSLVELPDGDLAVVWFHGSGERTADDVAIFGARRDRETGVWSAPAVWADTPGFPDTNSTLIVGPKGKLWLFYPTILDNRWQGALLKFRVASDLRFERAPEWERSEVLHMKPGEDFPRLLESRLEELVTGLGLDWSHRDTWPESTRRWVEAGLEQAQSKLTRRLGWFTRPHPYAFDDGRILVGLYSDGFSISAATYSDDDGRTWTFSEPIVGSGNVQPSFAERSDGTLIAFMRDNGPAPKRVLVAESPDRGETWSLARDHPDLVESGAGNEVLVLASGRWILAHNDTERGRHRLAVSISDNEGLSFPRRAHIERSDPETGRYHYPSVIQARDGTIHMSYSYHLADALGPGEQGKSIKHAWFSEEWLLLNAK
ncbi:MAG: sialidase family protein [Acidobacteriota bacterium]|nr:sialidase family protein [Acidobacteriota bacterium]